MANTKAKTQTVGIALNLSPELLEAIDDYSFKARIRSRNEVMRRLMSWALLHQNEIPGGPVEEWNTVIDARGNVSGSLEDL